MYYIEIENGPMAVVSTGETIHTQGVLEKVEIDASGMNVYHTVNISPFGDTPHYVTGKLVTSDKSLSGGKVHV